MTTDPLDADTDDVIIRMIADVISPGFVVRQRSGWQLYGAWLPKVALPAMEAALTIEGDGETRLGAILDVLNEYADKRVVTKFLAWDATPKLAL